MAKKTTITKKTKPAEANAENSPNEACACYDERGGVCGNIDSERHDGPCAGAGCPDAVPFETDADPKHSKPPRAQASMAIEPEIVGSDDSAALAILKRPEHATSLERLEESIARDLVISAKLDRDNAMVSVKIGLALQAAKAMLRHGQYEPWVSARFGETFGQRKAQYFSKIAVVFLQAQRDKPLELPAPAETGKWLAIADEVHPLTQAIAQFVGDKTIAELLDEHGVRPVRPKKGGWRPAQWLVSQYQDLHAELRNLDFEVWTPAQKDAFREWQEAQTAADDSAPKRMAAEATWEQLYVALADHGVGRKSWKLLTAEKIEQIHEVLGTVHREMGKALKHPESLEG